MLDEFIESIIEPISTEEQRYRYELKYKVKLSDGRKLLNDLLEYATPDPHVKELGCYEVSSLYYDTLDLRFYVDREESVGHRRKVRLRSYNEDGASKKLFVEIKEKHVNKVSKKRVDLIDQDLLNRYYDHSCIPIEAVLEKVRDSAEAREIAYLHKRLRLFPIVVIRYKRYPLIAKVEPNLRLTLDTNITAGGRLLDTYDPKNEKFITQGRSGIFEIKTNDTIPLWLQSILRRYRMSHHRFSKYCLGVRAIYGAEKPWLRLNSDSRLPEGDVRKAGFGL